ncbi:RNA-binding cell elongation regulator Jag/EloR [uncultured Anaerococcus sp.]|uniref:RNA-binding cell elongation regulator Jag/EloR n=1 Tax=uncultured Anaerococcus sp. TaxID=293428 RepID=UPI0026200330|nr:RNA-binding cell elongation regulator Jag/EloR [uncultured Anaerococcus sp.]
MKKSLTKSAKTVDEAVRLALDEIGKDRSEVTVDVIKEGSSGFLGLIGGKDAVVRVSYDEDMDSVLEEIKTEIEIDSIREVEKSYDVKKRREEIKREEGILEDEEENTVKEEARDLGQTIKEKSSEVEEFIEEKSEEIFEDEDKDQEATLAEENQEDEAREKRDYALSKKRSNIDNYYKAKELLEEILKAMHFENVSVIGNLEGSIIKLEAKVEEKDTGIAIGKGGSTLDAIEFIIRKAIDSRANNLRVNIDINNYKRRRDEKIARLARDTAQKVAQSGKSWNLRYMNSYERRLAHEEIAKHRNVSSHSEGREPQRYVVVDYVEE